MKKYKLVILLGCLIMSLSCCAADGDDNMKVLRPELNCESAIVQLDGEKIVEGHVDNYYYTSDGFVQVEIDDVGYATHLSNVVLIMK